MLTTEQRAQAREALALVEGTGLSLVEAVRRGIEGKRAARVVTVEAAADLFLRAKLKRRPATVLFYESRLRQVVASFGRRAMDEVGQAEWRAWVQALPMQEGGRASYVRTARALWRWAMAQVPAMAMGDPTRGMQTGAGQDRGSTAKFFTVDEVAWLLRVCPVEYRATLALWVFAGVRCDEVAGVEKPPMTWRCLDVKAELVRVPGECAKTGAPRVIEGLPGALWAWVRPVGAAGDRICPVVSSQVQRRLRDLWVVEQGRPWPGNGLRHTFATYALAHTQDAGKVAMWLGHEGRPTMLYRHYRGLATRAEARAFWALRP
jgi:integrase